MQTYLAPLVAFIGLLLYVSALARLGPKAATIGLVMLAAGLLATLLRMDASSFRLR